MSKRARLRTAVTAAFTSVEAAMKDPRCAGSASWLVSSIMNPHDPSFVAVPDPDAIGGEEVAKLCKAFNIT